ncbi:MAG: M48 family metallopeptidase [Rickettsiales bacterium]|nr:M48 family metallopeptidase [Rickettsiales bacterium]
MIPYKTKSITLLNQKTILYNIAKYTRKTLELSISPNKTINIKAPSFMSDATIENFIQKKQNWIIKKLNKKIKITQAQIKPKFINKELHQFLGQEYPIIISKSEKDSVRLLNNEIQINSINTSQIKIKELLYKWYRQEAKKTFTTLYKECWNQFSEKEKYTPPTLRIKKVKSIWGSLSSTNNMTLNLELIKYPYICIKYIIFHELCHLEHKNHGVEFKKLLSSNMSNWKEIKIKLNTFITSQKGCN